MVKAVSFLLYLFFIINLFYHRLENMKKPTFCLALCCVLIPACSVNKMAVKAVSDILSKEGSSYVFTSDSDPRLVGDALPFAIKMYESLLMANPRHQGLLRTTGSLFVMYASAFVQMPAEQLPREMYGERQAAMERAKKLYLRGLELLYRSLELKKDDVPSLYWAAAAGLSAYSLNPFDLSLGSRIHEFLALVESAYILDPNFNSGALDDLLLLYYASVPEFLGGDKSIAEIHFQRALEKSGGLLASPYVSYAQAISIPKQDYATFKVHLDAALAIDPDADPENRLVNIIFRQKAQYLLDSAALFFVDYGTDYDWDKDW